MSGTSFKICCPTCGLRLIYLAEADGLMFLLCAEHGTVAARPSGRVEFVTKTDPAEPPRAAGQSP